MRSLTTGSYPPMETALQAVNAYIHQLILNNSRLAKTLLPLLSGDRGKEIRPKLVLQVASLLGASPLDEKTYRAAAFISLLHRASLVHDDVIDEATYRRHTATLNQKLGNKKAVLYGDYLLSIILHAANRHKDYAYIGLLTTTIQEMVEGELLQLNSCSSVPTELHKTTYFKIIHKKTASLFGASCAIGAMAVAAPEQTVTNFYKVGKWFGIAFQLYDDMVDYGRDLLPGKPPCMDLSNNLFTLPLVYAFEQATKGERQGIVELIATYHATKDTTIVDSLLAIIKRTGGMAYTYEKLSQYRYKALAWLHQIAPADAARKALTATFEQGIPDKDTLKKMGLI